MSDQEVVNVNGHHSHDAEREVSQAPSAPDLRRRAEEMEIRQRVRVDTSKHITNPTEIQNEDFSNQPSTVISPVTAAVTSPTKSFEQYLKDDDMKRRQRERDASPESHASNSVESKDERESWKSAESILIVISSAVVAVFFVAVLWGMVSFLSANKTDVNGVEMESSRSWKSSRHLLLNRARSLMIEFEAQKQETWVQVLSAVNSTLSDHEPKQPSAIVLLVPPHVTREFYTCFVKRLAELVNDAHIHKNTNKGQTSQRVSVVKEMEPEYFAQSKSVTHIHDDLKEYLHQDKAVIFYDVDKIGREEHLLVFHGFCDSSQAYDKRATYFFVISVPQNVLEQFEWTHQNGEEIAQHILNTAWNDVLSEDKRPAVISRILANIVLINNGDSCK